MSRWRDTCAVHPAADVFPMMSDEEIDDLAADIKKHGLSRPIVFYLTTKPGTRDATSMRLLDGRNRMEALERIGQPVTECMKEYVSDLDPVDPVAYVVGANIKRRHLTKTQQAELIVAAVNAGEKLDRDEPVSRGGRGKVNAVKAKACGLAAEAGISASTVKRVLTGPKKRLPRKTSLEDARQRYLDQCAGPDVDLDAEKELIVDAMRELATRRRQ